MILSALCTVLGYVLGFLTAVAGAGKTEKQAAERGYISIGDTTYKLVPMDKETERNCQYD